MLIIADSGPLISFIQIEQLKLLEKLFPDFLLPAEVFDELIRYLGSIAILVKAKRSGLIPVIKPLLLEMRKHKRYISDELLVKTLKDEGED